MICGRVLKVKQGYNPNSSSIGTDLGPLLVGGAVAAVLVPVAAAFFGRKARNAESANGDAAGDATGEGTASGDAAGDGTASEAVATAQAADPEAADADEDRSAG